MKTLFVSDPHFLRHDTGIGHPESPERLVAIENALENQEFSGLIRENAPQAALSQLYMIHPQTHVERVLASIPAHSIASVDSDTLVSSGSKEAALRAVGGVCGAVDEVFSKQVANAFCAVRPPGHHAEPDRAMGFCLFNNIAIAAEHARRKHNIDRVAIVDFDVHHGNGTQAAFYSQANVLYASTHQMPLYPGTGAKTEIGVGNIFNAPLPAGADGPVFKAAMTESILPALNAFRPELLLISAGFDAHRDDPLASLRLLESDFFWVTNELCQVAKEHCNGRVVSVLEGGYNLDALGKSAAAHVRALMTD